MTGILYLSNGYAMSFRLHPLSRSGQGKQKHWMYCSTQANQSSPGPTHPEPSTHSKIQLQAAAQEDGGEGSSPHLSTPSRWEGIHRRPGEVLHEEARAQHADDTRQPELEGDEGTNVGRDPQEEGAPGCMPRQEHAADGKV